MKTTHRHIQETRAHFNKQNVFRGIFFHDRDKTVVLTWMTFISHIYRRCYFSRFLFSAFLCHCANEKHAMACTESCCWLVCLTCRLEFPHTISDYFPSSLLCSGLVDVLTHTLQGYFNQPVEIWVNRWQESNLTMMQLHQNNVQYNRVHIPSDLINTLRARKNGRHSPNEIFKCIFLNKNVWSSIKN